MNKLLCEYASKYRVLVVSGLFLLFAVAGLHAQTQRMVFAHYMVTNQDNQTYYIRYSAQIFEAAARLNSGFKLMFSADMCCGNGMNDVEDMMRRGYSLHFQV